MKKTKIICTLGPASETKTKMEKMIKSGLDVARLNFSHGSYSHHQILIKNLREASKKLGQPLAIMQDLQGPRIRTGKISQLGIKLIKDMTVFLVAKDFKSPIKSLGVYIPIQYSNLYKNLKPKDLVLIDDAKIQLQVLKIQKKAIRCKVKIGGIVTSHRGLNFPKSEITSPAITKKDRQDLLFGLKQNIDFVALSFVKQASDILNLRKQIYQLEKKLGLKQKDFKKPTAVGKWSGTHTRIIAKIERKEAVKNFSEILQAADGIMIARGDLGLEIPLENLPLIQKRIIRECIKASKPVIVATQMLESMVQYPIPTRAEVSDVANAILDGADAIMLSGETATGKYPLKAVLVMNKIAREIESKGIKNYELIKGSLKESVFITEAVSFAVGQIAKSVSAKLIVCATTSGFTARSIIRYKPEIKVVAIAATEKTRNQLCLSWGVTPYFLPFAKSFSQLIKNIKRLLLKQKLIKKGEIIVIAAGHPFGYLGQTNLIKVEKV